MRENTRAFKLGDTVSEEEKGRRLAEVIALQEATSLARNRALIGQAFPVLVEGPARRGERDAGGQDAAIQDRSVSRRRSISPGDTVTVRVESATAHTLHCALV